MKERIIKDAEVIDVGVTSDPLPGMEFTKKESIYSLQARVDALEARVSELEHPHTVPLGVGPRGVPVGEPQCDGCGRNDPDTLASVTTGHGGFLGLCAACVKAEAEAERTWMTAKPRQPDTGMYGAIPCSACGKRLVDCECDFQAGHLTTSEGE